MPLQFQNGVPLLTGEIPNPDHLIPRSAGQQLLDDRVEDELTHLPSLPGRRDGRGMLPIGRESEPLFAPAIEFPRVRLGTAVSGAGELVGEIPEEDLAIFPPPRGQEGFGMGAPGGIQYRSRMASGEWDEVGEFGSGERGEGVEGGEEGEDGKGASACDLVVYGEEFGG